MVRELSQSGRHHKFSVARSQTHFRYETSPRRHQHREDIRVLLGHGAKSITERYAHADTATLAAAVAKLETGTKTGTPSVVEFPRAEAV